VDGSVLAETDLSGNLIREFIYFNGERVARRESNGTVYYFFSDHVGTARVMTNATGVTKQESTYYPFGGEQRQIVNNVDNRYKFTGMERDGQAGLDHTQYREYSPMLSRWLSPDPICANCYDPQNLNRYSYVRNDPVNLIDPDGQDWDAVCATYNGQTSCSWTYFFGPNDANFYYWLLWGGGQYPQPPDIPPNIGGGGGGGGNTPQSPTKQNIPEFPTTNGIKQKICSAIPSGRTIGVSGGLGGVGSVGGGGELVVNYNSGQVSAFGFGGVQIGWNGGISGSLYSGFVYGLNNSNSNYSGGFTGVNGGAGLGGFAASSSGGLTGGLGRMVPNPRSVSAAGVSFGAGLLGGFSGGITATNYTNPLQLGKYWAFGPLDALLYASRQVCQ
jgi:RHS repeat-associated protein